MANGCRHLKHLSLPPVLGSPNSSCFNDNCLRVIAQGWSNLVTLTVGGKTITAEGLAEVGKNTSLLLYYLIRRGSLSLLLSLEECCVHSQYIVFVLWLLLIHYIGLFVCGSYSHHTPVHSTAQSCPNLRYLEIIHGPDLDKQAMTLLCQDNNLSSLTTLILNFTPSTHVALVVVLGHCLRLQRLDLHVTLHCYFPSQTNSGEDVSAYEQIIRNLKVSEY